MSWWFADAWSVSPVLAVGWVVWVIGSIVLHELAHGWVAIRLGDDTPLRAGHMTWNPLVHMGQTSLLLFALVGIAWGAMPVDSSRLRGRHGDALVAIAGPLVNLTLAAIALVLYVFWVGLAGGYWTGWHATDPLFPNTQMFLRVGVGLNLCLAAFNLLPIPPLDGFRVLGSLSPRFEAVWRGDQAQIAGLIAFGAVFFFAGPYIFDVTFEAAAELIRLAVRLAIPRAAF